MLKIRLSKIGKKNDAYYRVVLTPKTAAARSGKFLEILGSYNPQLKTIALNKDRILYWLSQGAKPSTTVHNLLVRENVIKGPKRKIKMPKPSFAKTLESEPKAPEAKSESAPAAGADEASVGVTEEVKIEETKVEEIKEER